MESAQVRRGPGAKDLPQNAARPRAEDNGDFVWMHTDDGVPGPHVVIRATWDQVTEDDLKFASRCGPLISQRCRAASRAGRTPARCAIGP